MSEATKRILLLGDVAVFVFIALLIIAIVVTFFRR